MRRLICIDAPHFAAAVIVKDDKVVDAAPILRYMMGKHVNWVIHYARNKKWTTTIMEIK